MNSHASKLDIDKLRKVRALMEGGKTEGERQAATNRAEALAARAGMTLRQALSKLDKPEASPSSRDCHASFDDKVEERQRGWKSRMAKEKSDRAARRIDRWIDLLKQYGPANDEELYKNTPMEARLREALASLPLSGHRFQGYDGWTSGSPTPSMWEALGAVSLPITVQAAWAEYQQWQALTDARAIISPDYRPEKWIRARQAALEHLLDTMRTPSVEGIRARLEWMQFLLEQPTSREVERDCAVLAMLRADFEALACNVQSGRRSATEQRAEVLALLRATPSLSDREIARRVGCSPQTVGNLRRRATE